MMRAGEHGMVLEDRQAELDALDSRELDLLIAVRQGWTWRQAPSVPFPMLYPPGDESVGPAPIAPYFSSEIEAAQTLLEDLARTLAHVSSDIILHDLGELHYYVKVLDCTVRNDTSHARAIATAWLLHAEGLIR